MEDKEVRELIKDLESVGLSDNPGVLTKGENGIVKITRGDFNHSMEDFPLIKGIDLDIYRDEHTLIFVRNLLNTTVRYKIDYQDEGQAKESLGRIVAYLNS